MKFNELSKEQQQVLTAWMNGETMQFQSSNNEWHDMQRLSDFDIALAYAWPLRAKPKEPIVSYGYEYISIEGEISDMNHDSITQINKYVHSWAIHSYLKKTYTDGVFVKAEIIPKGELSLKGLM